MRSEREDKYERKVLFAGLTNLNTGFDSPLIPHVSPEEFLIVIDRCESRAIQVIGIEVFTTDVEPPNKAALEAIEISEVPGYGWARDLVREYRGRPEVTVCATFDVPDALLNPDSKQEGESGDEEQKKT